MSGAVEFVDPDHPDRRVDATPTGDPGHPGHPGDPGHPAASTTADGSGAGDSAVATHTGDDTSPGRAESLLAAVLRVLAAAVCVLAAFRSLFVIRVSPPARVATLDGWGRGQAAFNGIPGSYGPRFGIVLCVVAGLLVVSAALGVTGVVRAGTGRPGITRVAPRAASRAAATAAAALTAGIASAALFAQSQIDGVDRALALEQKDTADSIQGFTHSATVGWFVWWGLVALALCVLSFAGRVPGVRRAVGATRARSAARAADRVDADRGHNGLTDEDRESSDSVDGHPASRTRPTGTF